MAVKFLKQYRSYGPGEVAGFRPEMESRLIEERFAERYKPTPQEEDDVAKKAAADKQASSAKTRQTTVGPQGRKK